jgi:hypothetical protein
MDPMASSVSSLFRAAGLKRGGVVKWSSAIPLDTPGVYVVALDEDPDSTDASVVEAPISDDALDELLSARQELRVDGRRPTSAELRDRIAGFWLADETVLYVGLASQSVRARVRAYYRTPLGARSPHAGGWFIKTLAGLSSCFVHWAAADDPASAEDLMLRTFCSHVSDASRTLLHDPDRPFPFANLEWPPGTRKAHGITGAKAPRGQSRTEVGSNVGPEPSPAGFEETSKSRLPVRSLPNVGRAQSQNVTESDLGRNQIRFPARAKPLFPTAKAKVGVLLQGKHCDASWDPRKGPDRERSGVLRFKRGDLAAISPGTIFVVTRLPNGMLDLQ